MPDIHDDDDAYDDDAPAESLEGRLLIAMPNIGDPRFDNAVIYMFSHRGAGAMGLVVNKRAAMIAFADLLKQLNLELDDTAPGAAVRIGGPVEMSRGFVLHSSDYHKDDATLRVDAAVSMTATVDVLRDMGRGAGPARAMVALGYAGWGPGQLEAEIAQNGWLHCEADLDILFDEDDASKWRRALGKIGVDPSLLSSAAGTA